MMPEFPRRWWCSQWLYNYLGNYAKKERKERAEGERWQGPWQRWTSCDVKAQNGKDWDSREHAAVKRNVSLLGIQKRTVIHKRRQIWALVPSPGVTILPSMRELQPAVFVLDNNSRMFVLCRRRAAFPSVTIRSEPIKTGEMEAGEYKNMN